LIRLGIFLFVVLVLDGIAQAEPAALAQPRLIEVFTTSAHPAAGREEQQAEISVTFHFYVINGIHQFEFNLSEELPADPKIAKLLLLKRIEHLGEDAVGHMWQSATGLAKAMQYGIDRYPAVVFDGAAVVYGVTDIYEALRHYQQWREGQRR